MDRFDKFTDRARKVLTLAQDEALRFNHNYIGTEHLLLGLVREATSDPTVAGKILQLMNVELPRVRTAVEYTIGRGDGPVVGDVGLTLAAKRVIELAIDEARRLGHHYIGAGSPGCTTAPAVSSREPQHARVVAVRVRPSWSVDARWTERPIG